jgi:hypothetical protein
MVPREKNGAMEITTGKLNKSNPEKSDEVEDLGLFQSK